MEPPGIAVASGAAEQKALAEQKAEKKANVYQKTSMRLLFLKWAKNYKKCGRKEQNPPKKMLQINKKKQIKLNLKKVELNLLIKCLKKNY